MIHPIKYRDFCKQVGIDPLEAAHVVPILIRKGAPLVMRVDAAVRAEVVLGDSGIELVQLEMLVPLDDGDAAQGH